MAVEHSHVHLDNEDVTLVIAIGGVVLGFGVAAALVGLVVGASYTIRKDTILPLHSRPAPRKPTLRALPRSLKRA